MRTSQTMTVSLPPQIVSELEQYRKKHNFTRSELVRHALRELFYRQFPVYSPTKAELQSLAAGRKEIKNGKFTTLEKLHAKLDGKNKNLSKK